MNNLDNTKKNKTLSHIAVIMDGNGRWAKNANLPTSEGHKKGAERAKEIVEECLNKKIPHLTLYTFSSENWNRPQDEINDILNLLRYYLSNAVKDLLINGVRLRFIGDISFFPEDIQKKCSEIEALKIDTTKLIVNVALNYGSKQEIVNAVKETIKSGKEISIENIEQNLYTANIPDPDLLIRTGGEMRLSNFLLWQMAYSEFYFTEKYWPDFCKEDLQIAIEEFFKRDRRFGGR